MENVDHYFRDFDKKKKIIIWKLFDIHDLYSKVIYRDNYWLWLYYNSSNVLIIINMTIFTIILVYDIYIYICMSCCTFCNIYYIYLNTYKL